MSLDEFIKILPMSGVDRPVINRTGIAGRFDFHLEFAAAGTAPELHRDDGDLADLMAPSVADALQDQLGLKLELATGPLEFLVIRSRGAADRQLTSKPSRGDPLSANAVCHPKSPQRKILYADCCDDATGPHAPGTASASSIAARTVRTTRTPQPQNTRRFRFLPTPSSELRVLRAAASPDTPRRFPRRRERTAAPPLAPS